MDTATTYPDPNATSSYLDAGRSAQLGCCASGCERRVCSRLRGAPACGKHMVCVAVLADTLVVARNRGYAASRVLHAMRGRRQDSADDRGLYEAARCCRARGMSDADLVWLHRHIWRQVLPPVPWRRRSA